MTRYGPNFRQDIDPGSLATLPKLCEYVGHAPDLQHLRGLQIPTADVEKLVYVGERGSIEVVLPAGDRTCPWRGVEIVEYDANGQPVVDGWTNAPPIPTFGRRAMNTADLFALGFSDALLDELAQEVLGERWEPDRVGKSDRRREMFDRVMEAAFGSGLPDAGEIA